MKERKENLGLSLTPEVREHVRILASSFGMSVNEIIASAIVAFPTKIQRTKEERARLRAQLAIGAVSAMVQRRDATMTRLASLFGKLRSDGKIDASTFDTVYKALAEYAPAKDTVTMADLAALPRTLDGIDFAQSDEEREAEAKRVIEELLGASDTDRLAELCRSWGGSLQETLMAAVEFLPLQDVWNRVIAKAEQVKKALAAGDKTKARVAFSEYAEATRIPVVAGRMRVGSN